MYFKEVIILNYMLIYFLMIILTSNLFISLLTCSTYKSNAKIVFMTINESLFKSILTFKLQNKIHMIR